MDRGTFSMENIKLIITSIGLYCGDTLVQ